MEVNQKRAEAAKACFDFNKNMDTVHVTADLECFGNRNDAVGHARTLEDSTIDVFLRDGDGAELDDFETEDVAEELNRMPDYFNAKKHAHPDGAGEDFELVVEHVNKDLVDGKTPEINQSSAMDALKKDPAVDEVTDTITDEVTDTITDEVTDPAADEVTDTVADEPAPLTPAQKRAATIAKNRAAAQQAK